MRHAPPVLRELFGPVLPTLEADEGDGAGWWVRFREEADRRPHGAEGLVAIARDAVLRADPRDEGRLFVSVRASFLHALEERVSPAALAVHVDAHDAAETVIAVSLEGKAAPSAKAMALVQGALLGFGARIAQGAREGTRDDRRCVVAVGAPKASFVERLIARGLDDDAIMLGLDANKLGRLVDGATAHARSGEALSMRALETDLKLTPTQARLALRLAEGASLREAAERLDMRYATARVHLKAVFAKAGVRTQAALVAKLLGGGA